MSPTELAGCYDGSHCSGTPLTLHEALIDGPGRIPKKVGLTRHPADNIGSESCSEKRDDFSALRSGVIKRTGF